MSEKKLAILGCGYAVPANIRTNDDPIFDYIKQHELPGQDLFKGYYERRVLLPDESIIGLMVRSSSLAMQEADSKADDIINVIGYSTVPKYNTPNGLALVHYELGLPDQCAVIPIQGEFANFQNALIIAHSMASSGFKAAEGQYLISCGCNWTQHLDYHQPSSIAGGDGAGSVVFGYTCDSSKFGVIDYLSETQTQYFGSMDMSPRPIKNCFQGNPPEAVEAFTKPIFELESGGINAFQSFGETQPAELVVRLLKKNGVNSKDITLISHQASSVLLDKWGEIIKPGQYLNTIKEYGNMTLASVMVTLAKDYDKIDKDYLVLLGIGLQQQAVAVLLKRQ